MDSVQESSAPVAVKTEQSSSVTDTSNAQVSNAKLRKRTKTGCLTCRRRRIKCGEERPICSNCVRSKRPCEGYNQRIIFKPAMEGWPGMIGPGNIIPHHTSMLPGAPRHDYHQEYTFLEHHTHFGIPIDEFGHPLQIAPEQMVNPGWPTPQYPLPQFSPANNVLSPDGPPSIPPTPISVGFTAQQGQNIAMAPVQSPDPLISPYYQESPSYQSYDPLSPNVDGYLDHTPHNLHNAPMGHALPTPATSNFTDTPSGYSSHRTDPSSGYFNSHSTQHSLYTSTIPMAHGLHEVQDSFDHKPGITRNFTGAPIAIHSMVPPVNTQFVIAPEPYDLNTAAVEWQSEDYSSSWNSDDDLELTVEESLDHLQHKQGHEILDMVIKSEIAYTGGPMVKDYNSFVYAGVMTEYDAEKFASPLRNPHTARVFAHFRSSTAPSIAIFERGSYNPSTPYDNSPAADSDRGAWTYALPVMALNHQGLLHAMLSLSSLHISKLQNDTPTPALKHYGYAIKHINRCVQHPEKRHNVTTLAATLLLGFYEVMTADHTKWCSHLTGAARLLQEINFREMEMSAKSYQSGHADIRDGDAEFSAQQSSQIDILDYDFLDRVVGVRIDRSLFNTPSNAPFDLQKYHLLQDLFWWYARQDVYQSIIAGNRLMLKFHRWSDCPPRAPIGQPDALYGTHDHLFLLFGRIADFSSKDRARKLKVMAQNGGSWRPHPDMQMPPRPTPDTCGAHGGGPVSRNPSGAPNRRTAPVMPNFYGMAPMPTKIAIPVSYFTNATTPPHESPTSEKMEHDLESETQAALAEWSQMYAALLELETRFGPALRPLDRQLYPSMSPFGPPIMYASFSVSVIWALYYAAHIIALRGHPHMPPFAHVAAGVAEAKTAEYANLIGRIAAGMMTEPIRHSLNPQVGATYCEVAIPLFVAGIQYKEPGQRAWLVDRTREVEALTGWASIGMIGQGCETAWSKAAAAGMGPPYVPRESRMHLLDNSTTRVPRVGINRATAEGHWVDAEEGEDIKGRRAHLAMGLLSNEKDLSAEEHAVQHEREITNHEMDPSLIASPSQLPYRPAL